MTTSLPDRYIVTGTLYTLDEQRPTAQAMAVADGTITAIGTLADVLSATPGAELVEHRDGVVLPGLVDAHNHHSLAGEEDLFRLSFAPTASIEEIVEDVRAYAAQLPAGEWVVGGAWGSGLADELATGGPLRLLDAATGDRPVLLVDDSRHNTWANSAAMDLAGLFDAQVDPRGGRFIRDADGKLTGLLLERAGAPIERARIAGGLPDDEYFARCSERGIELLAQHGVTAFQDAASTLEMLRGLRKLDDEGRLHAWVVSSMLVNDTIRGTEPFGEPLLEQAPPFASDHHRPTWTKIFLDGVPPTRTAAFLESYVGSHEHFGSVLLPPEQLEGWLRTAERHGVGVKIHCAGDAAVRAVLDAVERVRGEGSRVPVQIAHGQFITTPDRPRLAALDVIAEISPYIWFPGVIPQALESVLPAEVFAGLQPNRELLDLGTHLAVGSDWPVSESPNPWHAVHGLVTRQDPTGRFPGTLGANHAITREEAIAAVSGRAADAMGLGEVTGRLRVGQSADFVFLDRDPFTVDATELASTRVLATHFAGTRVYEAAP
ncbi:amidohydrolase [Actinokineospora enzanensis]|uniref:amidohydrolase n=1 Tax=Actinokineospora enzanensis TaxID=155975 RepID=UPI00036DF2AB|nr:amidohydrolase [Actinokineospora enzanensis]